MRKLFLAAVATITVVTGAAMSTVPASAIDFIIGGHRHCWYVDGWHGPGWYWCGYAHRHGRGWGGPEGWQGWHH